MAPARTCVPLLSAWVVLALLLSGAPVQAGDEPPVPRQGTADWAMYGATASHGFSNEATPPAALGRIWTFTGNVTASGGLGSAVKVGDFVYIADVDQTPPPSGPHLVVRRIHESNGSDEPSAGAWWTRVAVPDAAALAPPRSLAVDDAYVYVLFTVRHTGTNEYQEVLRALDVGSGRIALTFNGTGRHANPTPTMSAPVVDGDFLTFGSQDGTVYALNTSDVTSLVPAVRWSRPLEAVPVPVQSVPAVTPRMVYVTAGTKLYYLDRLANGAIVQTVDVGTAIPGSPTVHRDGTRDIVYVDVAGALRAYDGTFPLAPLWTFPASGNSTSTPAVSGSTVIARRENGLVFAVDAITGDPVWARRGLANVSGAPQSDVAASDGFVFLAAGPGYDLVTLDAQTGEVLHRHSDAARTALGSPVVAGDKVFVSEGARLRAYRGQPDVWVQASDVTPNLGQVDGGAVRGTLRVAIRNAGTEPAAYVRVRVYDGGIDPANLIGDFTVGNASRPLNPGGLSAGNTTGDVEWTVGTHQVWVDIDPVDQETNVANNRVVVQITVQKGPGDTVVVGAGPYGAALLLGFLVGLAVLYFPMRRLRELRRKEQESETEPKAP